MELVFPLILTFSIFFIIFLVLRELMCWYWKINDIVKILSRIEAKLSTNEQILATINKPRINEESAVKSITGIKTHEETENDLMLRYGITYENEKYLYKSYKYDTLEHAINYARLCEERGNK